MSERAASSTAVLVCQGRAVADGRYAVDRFSDPVAWHLLDPGERVVVEQARAGHPPDGGRDRMAYELVRRTGLLMVPRTIAIDDAVRDARCRAGRRARCRPRLPGLADAGARRGHRPRGRPPGVAAGQAAPGRRPRTDRRRGRAGRRRPRARAARPGARAGRLRPVPADDLGLGGRRALPDGRGRRGHRRPGRRPGGAGQPPRRELPVEVADGLGDAPRDARGPAAHPPAGPPRGRAVALHLVAGHHANHALRERVRDDVG